MSAVKKSETLKPTGFLTQIIGPVVDVEFPNGDIPKIYNALIIETGTATNVICEVQYLIGDNKARAIAMTSTDGLRRGMGVVNTGAPISVPVAISTPPFTPSEAFENVPVATAAHAPPSYL